MSLYEKIYQMNALFGIWRYSPRFRITYVAQGWLVVWDHQQTPPTRYDCHCHNHHEACAAVIQRLRELA